METPTLSRLAEEGIAYNRFHTTAMCSPTRASLMTGRNHHRVGAGQIAEFANDWDGYTGVIPKSSATIAEVLRHYGYATAYTFDSAAAPEQKKTQYSLMNDLASEHPKKLEELKALFMEVAEENKVLPIGGAMYTGLHPHEMKRSSNTEWTLFEGMTRIPESEAPNVRNGNLRAEIEAEVPEGVNGVIFAMGGYAGGVSLYALDGLLYYE